MVSRAPRYRLGDLATPLLAILVVLASLIAVQRRNAELDRIGDAVSDVGSLAALVRWTATTAAESDTRQWPALADGMRGAADRLKAAMREIARLEGGGALNTIVIDPSRGRGKGIAHELDVLRTMLSGERLPPALATSASTTAGVAVRATADIIATDLDRLVAASRARISDIRLRLDLAQLMAVGLLLAAVLLERYLALTRARGGRPTAGVANKPPDSPAMGAVMVLGEKGHVLAHDVRFGACCERAGLPDPIGRPGIEVVTQLFPGGRPAGPGRAGTADSLTADSLTEWLRDGETIELDGSADGPVSARIRRLEGVGWMVTFAEPGAIEPEGDGASSVQTASHAHQLSAIAEHMRDPILLCRPGGEVLWANPAFMEVTGFSPDEVVGQTPWLQVGAGTDESTAAQMMDAFDSVETSDFEILLYNRDGTQYWAELLVSPVLEEDGRPTRYICAQRDVTKRRATRERLVESEARAVALAARAEAASREKSSFLAKMSHEIRTPMNGVIGMSELLAETALSEEQRVYLDAIRESGEALLTIINDILDFSKMEADRLRLETAPFDLSGLLEDLLLISSVRAASKGVELVLNYAEDLPAWYVGDAGRIRQIVTNLVGNAIKFTPEGSVVVSVEGAIEGDAATLDISVRDTGVGIDPDYLPHIFDEFSQATETELGRAEGTGLGMAIVQRLVEMMEGDIWVESERGKGSTFFVRLPLPLAEQAATIDPPPEADIDGRRALVVDDHQVNLALLRRRLEKWGMEVEACEDPLAALELVRDRVFAGAGFDLVLLDHQMPEMDGPTLAREIRQVAGQVPMLLLSSAEMDGDNDANRRGLFAGRVLKPLRTRQLAAAVSAALAPAPVHSAAPCAETRVEHETPASDAAPADGGSTQTDILIAEDNRTNQLVIAGMLRDQDVRLHLVENGEAALRAFRELSPALIFMDVQMPGLDGFAATRQIREMEATEGLARTPIVALTASALSGDRERCLEAGMDDYVTKPASKPALIEALARHLPVSRGEVPCPVSERQRAVGG